MEPECGQIWANCDHFIHGNPCLLHSKLCYQHKYFVTRVTNRSAKLESTAVRQLGWFHTWREVKQPPAWQQPQPGTIISFLAMHTAQITHKYLTNIAQILHKGCSYVLRHPAQMIQTNTKGLSTTPCNNIFFPLEVEEKKKQLRCMIYLQCWSSSSRCLYLTGFSF